MNEPRRINLYLRIEQVNDLCAICESFDFDINVICGRICVDGKSVVGVTEMCGRVVRLDPITNNDSEYQRFIQAVKRIGAYEVLDY